MKTKLKRISSVGALAVACLSIVAVTAFTSNYRAEALSASSNIFKKAMATAIRQCYADGIMQSPIDMTTYDMVGNSLASSMTTVQIPNLNGYGNSIGCYELINNSISWVRGTDTTAKANFLVNNLGYTKTDGASEGECFYFQYGYDFDDGTKTTYPTSFICADKITNGKIDTDKITIRGSGNEPERDNFAVEFKGGKKLTIDCKIQQPGDGFSGSDGTVNFQKGVTSWEDFKNTVKTKLNSTSACVGTRHGLLLGGYTTNFLRDTSIYTESTGDVTATFTINDKSKAAGVATNTILGTTYDSDPTFDVNETFSLYQDYVQSYYNADIVCNLTDDQRTGYKAKGWSEVAVYSGGSMKTDCLAIARANAKSTSSAINDSSKKFGQGDYKTFAELCEWLKNHAGDVDVSKLEVDATVRDPDDDPTPTPTPTPTPGKTSSDDLSCDDINIQDGKIGSMQWILCPAMDNTRYTASWIDEKLAEWMDTDTSIYNNDAVKGVWDAMRNIANVLMIVLLSVIVFSQLTGYGIDNYGIKKMLPRLIVMAILINLSLYICQIAADLSNIFGVGLRNLFASMGGASAADWSGKDYLGTAMLGVFSAASIGGSAGVSAGIAAFTLLGSVAVALIVVFIVVFLVVLVALIVFFLMLGARQVITVACIILAPLAFAAFILPNTQNLFRKWWDLYKAALIIFPICGAVSGISYLLRKMNSGGSMGLGVAGGIIMIILPYLVFFLLPTLLKSALSALGKVGGALTSLGNTVRNGGRAIGQGAMRGAQNSQRYKDWSQDVARRQQEQRANRIMNRFGDGKTINDRIADAQRRISSTQDGTREHRRAVQDLQRAQADQRRFYEAQQTHYQLDAEQAVAGTSPDILATRAASRQEALELKNYSDQYSTLTRGAMSNELNAAVDAYQADRSASNGLRLQAAIAAAEQRGMSKEMLEGKMSGLSLSTRNAQDTKILGQMAGSSNKLISQYGKQVGKLDATKDPSLRTDYSMNQFTSANVGDSASLTQAFENQGANVLNGMDDDTLGYISKTNQNAVSTQMLVNAAMSTSNKKELDEINKILSNRASTTTTDYELKPAELARLNINTINSMNSLVYNNAVRELINTKNTDASRQIINSMDQDVRAKFGL